MYFDSRKNLEVAINLFYKWDCYDTECTKTKPVCGSLTKIILERRKKWGHAYIRRHLVVVLVVLISTRIMKSSIRGIDQTYHDDALF